MPYPGRRSKDRKGTQDRNSYANVKIEQIAIKRRYFKKRYKDKRVLRARHRLYLKYTFDECLCVHSLFFCYKTLYSVEMAFCRNETVYS